MDYRIEQRRADGTLVRRLDRACTAADTEYLRLGGCGVGRFVVPAPIADAPQYQGSDDLRVYLVDSGVATLVYRGLITSVELAVGEQGTITITTDGYRVQLGWTLIDATWFGKEVSQIVTDLLDTYVLPATDITYDPADIEPGDYVVDAVTFMGLATSAIETLAQLAGAWEWGVDRNAKFFFRRPSEVVAMQCRLEAGATRWTETWDYSQIVNRILVRGAGTVKVTRNDLQSQARYGVRSDVVYLTSLTTEPDAERYGDAVLAQRADVAMRGQLTLAKDSTLFEAGTPVPRLSVQQASTVRYGERLYAEDAYNGEYPYQVQRISRRMTETGCEATLDLGLARPRLADLLTQLSNSLAAARPT